MTSAFTAQLGQIAATSTNELDLRAQKTAHAQSLIFERKAAGSQDFETIYQLCLEGYRDLCQLDQRFLEFQRNIFNIQSKDQDRSQMTAQENTALNSVLEQFLVLLGGRLLLRPALKALEWLVRRFKVHIYNTSHLISTFLPYHDTPIFQNLLSILPTNLPIQYKFLGPYLKTATNPPRHAIAYSAISSDPFFATFCSYALQTCRQDAAYTLFLTFWTSVATEAVAGRVGLAQSGRREVQQQRQADVLLKILPVLSEGLLMRETPEMILACYIITVILANKFDMADNVIDSLMETIALSLSANDMYSGIVCLSILAERQMDCVASKSLLESLLERPGLAAKLIEINRSHPINGLIHGLTRGALQGLNKKNYAARLEFVAVIAESIDWQSAHISTIFEDFLKVLLSLTDNDAVTAAIRARLIHLLRLLCQKGTFFARIHDAANELGVNQTELESLLGQILPAAAPKAPQLREVEVMEIDDQNGSEDELGKALKHIPERTVNEHSFLVKADSILFQQLSNAYQVNCRLEGNNGEQFRALPVWHTASQDNSTLYVSFLLRMTTRTYPEICRVTALRAIAQEIEGQQQPLDCQALLFYVIPRLADPAQSIRQLASEVLITMHSKVPHGILEKENCRRWGANDLYATDTMDVVRWLEPSDLAIVLEHSFMPALEECVADYRHISEVVRKAFLGSAVNVRAGHQHRMSDPKDLKKALRHAFFESLLSHLIATPLLSTKVEMLDLLDGIDRVGSSNKSKALKVTIQQWAALSGEEAAQWATREDLDVSYVNNAMIKGVASSDKDTIALLLDLVVELKQTPRSSFLDSIFEYLTSIWPKMAPVAKAAGAQRLVDLALEGSVLSERARSCLPSLDIPTAALLRVLNATFSVDLDDKGTSQARKRRRSSSGSKPSVSALKSVTSHMILALELVDGSNPESRPELLLGLFEALGTLQNLKRLSQRAFPYLLSLCLNSMLAIVRKVGPSPKLKKELASVRIDLVTDCVTRSDNPQVQNAATLLSAELARIVPEKVLHNVMPIFTFVGGQTSAKDDDYSVYVSNQAIDQIIPPLMQTLQTQKKDVRGAISDILSIFSAAFEHMSQHRRLNLYQRLLSKLGTEDILNTLVAMLRLRNAQSGDIDVFVMSLMKSFSVDVQLQTLHDLLNQAVKVSLGDGELAKKLSGTDFVNSAISAVTLQGLIAAATNVVKATNLGSAFMFPLSPDEHATSVLETKVLNTMKLLMQLDRDAAGNEDLSSAVERCTKSLLNVLPFPKFLDISGNILKSQDACWHQDALLLLEERLTTAALKDMDSCKAGITMLATLTSMIQEEAHDRVKHAAIRCIDRVTELYGRRGVPAVVEAANVLATSTAISSEKPGLQTVTLLCLASMLDCVKEAIIPVVPNVMSFSLDTLRESLSEDAEDERLHNAAYSLVSAIISNVPFMISESNLDDIMKLSAESANVGLGQACHMARKAALALLARKLDIKHVLASLHRTWPVATENDLDAAIQALDILSNSLKYATKASVVALSEQASEIFTQIADLRRVQLTQRDEDGYTDEEVIAVEQKASKVCIDFVYKLNDTTFRPILLQWIDWAANCPGVLTTQIDTAKLHRQTALFSLLAYLFGTLKSIVTPYASHILEPAVQSLRSTAALSSKTTTTTNTFDQDRRILWVTTCDMIAEACKYDQDSFFASPSHFSALAEPLVAQLKRASDRHLPAEILVHVIPAIVALAFATADIVSHHKDLNHHICQLRHSEAGGVRMASIQAQHALIVSEDVGEEWVNNVVQGGGEMMVYINEMLEDDDEDVEREVRRFVRRVREMVGEDIFGA